MAMDLGPYDQYYFAAIVIVGTYLAASGLLWLTQASRCAGYFQRFHGVAQNFLTVINVIFALNLAFLANDTWTAHDRALDAVYQEAGGLRTIMDFAETLPQPGRGQIAGAAKAYAEVVVADEWPLLARRGSSPAAAERLDRLVGLLAAADAATDVPPAVRSQALEQAVRVRSMRDVRIALSQTHVNPLKWMGMAFLGFLTMISITMVHIQVPRAQMLAVLLFATAAAPTAALILVHGNPFQKPMAVSPAPIAAAVTYPGTAASAAQ